MFEFIVFLTTFINVAFTIPYIFDTYNNKTKPNKVSWFMWLTSALIVIAVELSHGVKILPLLPMIGSAITCLMVLIVSIAFKRGYYQLGKIDYFCGGLSLVSLMVWLGLEQSALAIFIIIFSDLIATIPTWIKTWKMPDSESIETWYGSLLSMIASLFVLEKFDFVSLAYPIYIAIASLVVIFLIKRKSIKKILRCLQKQKK